MHFRPCIDLHQGKVKQIVGSTLNDSRADENFVAEKPAAWYASLYRERGLTGGHVIMLGPGNEAEALAALQAFHGGLQVGGGITPENAESYLAAGASHVIVTSFVFRDGRLDETRLDEIVRAVGRERLVLDLSCKRVGHEYYIATDRWQKISSLRLEPSLLQSLSGRCDQFLVHAADVEGKRNGIEEPVVRILNEGSPIPAAYAGGIRNFEDIERIGELGGGRIDFTVGSALDLFGGPLSFEELAAAYPGQIEGNA